MDDNSNLMSDPDDMFPPPQAKAEHRMYYVLWLDDFGEEIGPTHWKVWYAGENQWQAERDRLVCEAQHPGSLVFVAKEVS